MVSIPNVCLHACLSVCLFGLFCLFLSVVCHTFCCSVWFCFWPFEVLTRFSLDLCVTSPSYGNCRLSSGDCCYLLLLLLSLFPEKRNSHKDSDDNNHLILVCVSYFNNKLIVTVQMKCICFIAMNKIQIYLKTMDKKVIVHKRFFSARY